MNGPRAFFDVMPKLVGPLLLWVHGRGRGICKHWDVQSTAHGAGYQTCPRAAASRDRTLQRRQVKVKVSAIRTAALRPNLGPDRPKAPWHPKFLEFQVRVPANSPAYDDKEKEMSLGCHGASGSALRSKHLTTEDEGLSYLLLLRHHDCT